MNQMLKQVFTRGLVSLGINAVFRQINRRKLLVVMYHGVTRNSFDPPVWTQIPEKTFRDHMGYLRKHYVFVTLDDVVSAVRRDLELPPRAALITFDDGLRNNYHVAFPILLELGIPAAIFLTVSYIGSESLLWFDELYFLLKRGYENKVDLSVFHEEIRERMAAGKIWEAYSADVEMLKRCGENSRASYLDKLREKISLDTLPLLEDFGLLDWDQVYVMHDSRLVAFGTHTATHRILTELSPTEWEEEIAAPRRTLEGFLGVPVKSFCFPNGRSGIDFCAEHLRFIRKSGYECAFTTENSLFTPMCSDPFAIGRIPAGNDATSSKLVFSLNCSGCYTTLRRSRIVDRAQLFPLSKKVSEYE